MAVIVKQQIDQMTVWSVAELGLPEGTPLDPANAIRYVDQSYPGGLKGFIAEHPDPGLTPEQAAAAKTQGLGGPYWSNPHRPMTDEEFTKTAPYKLLCREFEIPASGDAAAHLNQADRELFFQLFDQLKQDLA